jgi:hypothetical protein
MVGLELGAPGMRWPYVAYDNEGDDSIGLNPLPVCWIRLSPDVRRYGSSGVADEILRVVLGE